MIKTRRNYIVKEKRWFSAPYQSYGLILIISFFFNSYMVNAQKENVLLIISDDLNTRIGPYMDIDKHTPHLDRLANEGVSFTRAYSQFPLCGPSRASFMSGLYPETNGVLVNNDTPGSYRKETPELSDHPSMAGFFREHGYFTARVSKIFHMGVPGGIERGEPGGDDPDSWDYAYNVMAPETLSSGKLEFLSPANPHLGGSFTRMILPNEMEETQADYMAASQAIAILESRAGKAPDNATNKQKIKKDAPFFLAVGFVRPHVPLIAPENCFLPYPENEVVLPEIKIGKDVPKQALRNQNDKIWEMNEVQKRQTISAYMASIRFMDQQVGRLLDALDRLKLREETIVIFLSDHGYNLGEHDSWSKRSLWEGSIRVPLIFSVPGYEKNYGTSSNNITELLDLYPTLTDLSGFKEQQPTILQGTSLVEYIAGNEVEDKEALAYTVYKHGMDSLDSSIRTDRWRYTRWGRKVEMVNEELYDHKNDPEELSNLADNPDYKTILKRMREKMNMQKAKAKNQIY